MSRAERVSRQIQQIVGDHLIRVKPEGFYDTMITVTKVEISDDLLYAKIYLSIFPGDEDFKRKCMAAVIHARGKIRQAIGREMVLRNVPEIKILLDNSLDHAETINKLLQKV